jgi:chitin disaccharide deacetylase
VIVNADDFGRDDATNGGIIRAFEEEWISSTTLMANQPGFEGAVELAHEHRLQRHVGVHLVLTSGVPLTDPIRRVSRFCDSDGVFRSWRATSRVWRLDGLERDAIAAELAAQVRCARDRGLEVTHLDSHHHVHNEWAIATCVIDVARHFAIPYVRVARNCGPGLRPIGAAYKRVFNQRLRRRDLARTRWFGDAADWLHLRRRGPSETSLDDFELMVHPRLRPDGGLIDTESGRELSDLLAPVAGVRSATSFAGARRGDVAQRGVSPRISRAPRAAE